MKTSAKSFALAVGP